MAVPIAHDLPCIQRLSVHVHCILGCNPGPFTLAGTNTYLIGTGSERILVDTSDGNEEYLKALSDFCSENSCKVRCIIVTHSHYDHCGGVPALLKLTDVVSSSLDVYQRVSSSSVLDSRGYFTVKYTDDPSNWYNARNIEDSDVIDACGVQLRAVHTPGHTADSISLCFDAERSVFVGDCVLGTGSTSFQNLHKYMNSLKTLEILAPSRLYCGHGPCIGPELSGLPLTSPSTHIITTETGLQRIQLYIKHRLDREKQVIGVLKEASAIWHTPESICKRIYLDSLPPALHSAATAVVALHCEKLVEDGLVRFEAADTSTISTLTAATSTTVTRPSAAQTTLPLEHREIRGVNESVYHGHFQWITLEV